MAEQTIKEPRRGARPPGHVCHVCQDAIPVTDMLILVLSGMWSVQVPELPQLQRQLKLHPDCAQEYISRWQEEKLHD